MSNLRILIAAEHASVRFGGEAALPYHYFRVLRGRGMEAWLLCHERTRQELEEAFPGERDRLLFVKDTALQENLWKLTANTVSAAMALSEAASQLLTQAAQRGMIKKLVREKRIDVVHVPIPVSPVRPSAIFDVGAPVVFGPMNGGITYPEGFSHHDSKAHRAAYRAAQLAASAANVAMPGKRKAAMLLVANERTRRALPASLAGVPTIELVENGVDMARFSGTAPARAASTRTRFAFVGRLVDWKAVDILLEALAKVAATHDVALDIYGDGAMRPALEAQRDQLRLGDRVVFHGFIAQDQLPKQLIDDDGLILPSLKECGGAVVLEAMALGLPVIATRWGGPVDYLDESCGMLIEPRNRDYMVTELSAAMRKLAESPALRQQLGASGQRKVREGYDWERKVDRILELYAQAAG